jgi:PKD repeat protein
VVTGPSAGAPAADFSVDASGDPLLAFTDLSTNSPTSWDWNFGDGATDNVADPSHTYAANGTYTVCLTASNAAGSDTHCESVTVGGVVLPPVAAWSVDTAADPTFVFTDMSTNSPDTWAWDFGDGTTDVTASPSHTYLTNGLYTVCLVASNSAGSSAEVCQDIAVRMVPSGLGSVQASSLVLAPNPASSSTVLSLPSALSGEGQWSIHDATGRLMRQGVLAAGSQQLVLDVQGLAPGTYAVSLRGQNSLARGSLQVIR